MLNYYSKN